MRKPVRTLLAPVTAAIGRVTAPLTAAFLRLSPRERRLAIITGSVIFLLGNYFILGYLFDARRTLSATLAGKRQAAANADLLRAEAPRWLALDGWRREHQPRLAVTPLQAGGQLLTQVKAMAAGCGVTTETEQILPTEIAAPGGQNGNATAASRFYQPIAVSLVAKGSWPAMVKFLAAVQGNPEAFLVLEACTLRTETNDAGAMRGEVRIAKWYAPAGT